MSGYTPLFSSLTTGTLCGRWPDIGLWPIVLSMSDKHGVVDVTPAYISGVTGLPLADVVACMKRFCEPDPYSRSPADAGARLALIDSHRDWGWKVINHGVYREKARKQMQQIEYTQSGRDAERKRIERERMSSDVQSRPAVSGSVRPSDSDSDSDSDSNSDSKKKQDRSARAPRSARATRLPEDFKLTPERRAIAEGEKADPDREFVNFVDHWKAASGAKARKNDWDATWRIWCRRAPDFKPRPRRSDDFVPERTWRPTDEDVSP